MVRTSGATSAARKSQGCMATGAEHFHACEDPCGAAQCSAVQCVICSRSVLLVLRCASSSSILFLPVVGRKALLA